jgi:hypothetical protein
VLIADFGEPWCFALDALSYVAVVASLLAMRRPAAVVARRETNMLEELRVGWQYVSTSIPIRTALLLLAIVSTFSTPHTVLMPAIAGGVYLAQRKRSSDSDAWCSWGR